MADKKQDSYGQAMPQTIATFIPAADEATRAAQMDWADMLANYKLTLANHEITINCPEEYKPRKSNHTSSRHRYRYRYRYRYYGMKHCPYTRSKNKALPSHTIKSVVAVFVDQGREHNSELTEAAAKAAKEANDSLYEEYVERNYVPVFLPATNSKDAVLARGDVNAVLIGYTQAHTASFHCVLQTDDQRGEDTAYVLEEMYRALQNAGSVKMLKKRGQTVVPIRHRKRRPSRSALGAR